MQNRDTLNQLMIERIDHMSKIFYHSADDDGRCAAALVKRELISVFENMTDNDFIGYNHGEEIVTPEFKQFENVFIVDLSLNSIILNKVIKPAVEAGARVVHIDHHKTTRTFLDEMSADDKAVMSEVTTFYGDVSATMLTWVYALMDEDERKNPYKVDFDFTETFSHVAFYPDTNNMREYNIPDVIRYIDDNDIWRHALEETKYFCIAFKSEEDKHPNSDIWNDLIYSSSQRKTFEYTNKGKIIIDYQTAIDKVNLEKAFESEVLNHKCLCLNTANGNSSIFGDKIHEYPMVCRFSYDGSLHMWRYSFYSSEKYSDWVDVELIARELGGGGHEHAAGCTRVDNIFGDDWVNGELNREG